MTPLALEAQTFFLSGDELSCTVFMESQTSLPADLPAAPEAKPSHGATADVLNFPKVYLEKRSHARSVSVEKTRPAEIDLRKRDLKNALSGVVVDESAWDNPNSAESRALNWMAAVDPMNLDVATAPPEILVNERYVVVLLYFATNGNNWIRTDLNFLSGSSVCSWHNSQDRGVTCDSRDSVESIDLYTTNLEGTLPGELGILSSLTELSVGTNSLVGNIPLSIGNLSKLEVIDVTSNVFVGRLDEALFRLPQLERVYFGGNQITDQLPSSICESSSLQLVTGEFNGLVGTIPSCLGLSISLTKFDMAGNFLVGGLPEFSPTSVMEEFEVRENLLTGTIPVSLTNLTTLSTLDLADNSFSGRLPQFAGAAGQLSNLGIEDNEIDGSLETIFATAPANTLEVVQVENNKLTGRIPTRIGLFQKLQDLWVHNNFLTGTIPTEIGLLRLLDVVLISGNLLRGSIPTEVGNLVNCRGFSAGFNELDGTIPTEFGNMAWAILIDMSSNRLSGIVPTEFGNCANLVYFGVSGNERLIGRMDELLDALSTSLEYFTASGTSLSGSIPTTVGRFAMMEDLHLRAIQLTGTVPTEIGRLTNLLDIDLSINQFRGTLPSELGSLGAATSLNFRSNSFSGALASDFSGW
eukprot:CAMPEP_0116869948 /NCGR_PEP_ID=MMETSP0418-20121206/28033_1 /TAXON_ID=1158023 /ORGANISM="Astrosyne radiata, Strain 13vi08-1A" /LENGTH=637 /DNA_ID=CAMNT_0004506081 /DNA_START=48 /DNA_END=1960 /DNA_ORIENTATION=-